jgi:NTE family protein
MAMTEKSDAPKRVALVIGSGGVKCAAALGVQQALRDAGIGVDMLVGCSGGTLYAAASALGWDVERATEETHRLWTREVTSRRKRGAFAQILLPRWFRFTEDFALRDDALVRERIQAAFGDLTFADTKTPFYVAATDFWTGEQVVLSSGLLRDAIRASIAIPMLFSPWVVDGRHLVDGFLSDPLPVNVAVREGADVIVAIGFEANYMRRINSLGRYAAQLSSVMTNNLLRSRFAFHSMTHHSELIAVVPEFDRKVGVFDTSQIPYLIDRGRQTMEQHIPYVQRLLEQGGRVG